MKRFPRLSIFVVAASYSALICCGCGSKDGFSSLASNTIPGQVASPSNLNRLPSRIEAILEAIQNFTPETGLTWKTISQRFSSSSIAYGNGKFVAVGSMGCLQTSADGTHWTTHRAFDGENFDKIIFAEGKFLALASFGKLFSSTDGVEWEKISAPYLFDISFDNGRFFGISSSYKLMISADGESWSEVQPLAQRNIGSIAYRDGVFIATEHILTGGDVVGRVFRSTDNGQSWTEQLLIPARARAEEVRSNDSSFVILLSDNQVVSSHVTVNDSCQSS